MNINNLEQINITPKIQEPLKGSDREHEESSQQRIRRLATLPFLEYQQCRVDESKILRITTSALDTIVKQESAKENVIISNEGGLFPLVEPHSEPVDGIELLDFIFGTIKRFTILDDEYIVAATLWIVFTWLHEFATVSPTLFINSPEKRCGKSVLLSVLMELCFKPLVASNISSAAVYRAIEKWNPTLVIDEADTFLANSDDLRGIMNAGHYKRTAFVIRCAGDDNDPTPFSTWGAKLVAGIGDLPETMMDRTINIEMTRKLPEQSIENIRHAEDNLFEKLLQKISRWTQDNAHIFKGHIPQEVSGLNDRANDNWEPLLAIAEIVGGDWENRAREAALKLSITQDDTPSAGEQLLGDALEVFDKIIGDRIATQELLSALCADIEKPWATWNRGQPIAAYQLSKKLRPFNIKPKDIRFVTGTKKGYFKGDFAEAYTHYVPQKSATEATDATDGIGGFIIPDNVRDALG